jgi:hypothetical protein
MNLIIAFSLGWLAGLVIGGAAVIIWFLAADYSALRLWR